MRIRRVTSFVIELDSQESADVHMAMCSWVREMLPIDSPTQRATIEKLTDVFSRYSVGDDEDLVLS